MAGTRHICASTRRTRRSAGFETQRRDVGYGPDPFDELWLSLEWWADEARVRDGLLRLIDAAETDEDYGIIAAGPLDVFVCDDESRVQWIEQQARSSPAFRRALARVRAWELSDRMFWRVEKASGTQLDDPYAEHGIRRRDED